MPVIHFYPNAAWVCANFSTFPQNNKAGKTSFRPSRFFHAYGLAYPAAQYLNLFETVIHNPH